MKLVRETKYSKEILSIINKRKHATNLELLKDLKKLYPKVSATTVHRASARLLVQNKIQEAPVDLHGSMRYDSNLITHDHFICTVCGGIRDIDIAEDFLPKISNALGGCRITGRLIIQGSCEKCLIKFKGE